MEKQFNDEFQERMVVSNRALITAYNALDPSDPKYFENLKILSALADKVNSDYKSYADIDAESARSEIEQERLKQDAETAKNEKRSNMWKTGVSIASLLATIGMFAFGEIGRNKRIDKVTAYEDEHAVLKSSEKIAVQDCLRDDNNNKKGGLLQLPFLR